MGYRIKTVANLLGVPRNTLLAWERRYNIVKPARLTNGYREYSEDDIRRLRELKRLIDDGHRVGEAVSLMLDAENTFITPEAHVSDGLGEEILAALLRFDQRTADELLRRCGSMPYDRRIDEIFFPLQRYIGELWAEDSLSTVQEHIVSHFVREKLQSMLMSLGYGPAAGRLTLCAAYPEDQHDIALLGLAVKLAMSNHRIIYIGARTPFPELAVLVRQHSPELVCISVTMPQTSEKLVEDARLLSEALCGTDVRVAIGGPGLPHKILPTLPNIFWTYSTKDLIG